MKKVGPLALTPERDHTDESLRIERDSADGRTAAKLAALDATAGLVIRRARARADALIAASRALIDRDASGTASRSPEIDSARSAADRALHAERADADAMVQGGRAVHAAELSSERSHTDQNLLIERGRADADLHTRDDFLGMVSHDLRNLLNAVVGFASLIELRVDEEDHVGRVRADAAQIQRAGAHMDRLIGDLVDIASIQAGRLTVTLTPGDAAPVVLEAVETFQALALASEVTIAAEITPTAPVVFDGARILQVLANLLSNAIKFTPAGGRVVVRLEQDGHHAQIAVTDDGPGIAADTLGTVFDRYVQGSDDRRGVGLGLFISRRIVEAHGGTIGAASVPGEGSTFFFTLPLAAPA